MRSNYEFAMAEAIALPLVQAILNPIQAKTTGANGWRSA